MQGFDVPVVVELLVIWDAMTSVSQNCIVHVSAMKFIGYRDIKFTRDHIRGLFY